MFPRTCYAGREGSPELIEEFWEQCREGLVGQLSAEQEAFSEEPKSMTVDGRIPSYVVRPWPAGGWDAMSLGERVMALSIARIGMTTAVAQHWAEAAATMALPQNLPYAVKHLAETADEVWWLAGCRSTDLSWYLRRASISLALSSSEVYLTRDLSLSLSNGISDSSIPFASTYDFLCDRLNELEWLKGVGEDFGNRVEFGMKSVKGVVEAQTGFGRWV
ncbi:Ubiquinone biosynthesis protein coq9, mitochondrial [Gonapodya sp. JEL0774]|nr:Ubiquinone biosynthesis protein coq9, mitochondrial [Gonapodya sp. JEL0774]